jgi:hypothetical protein
VLVAVGTRGVLLGEVAWAQKWTLLRCEETMMMMMMTMTMMMTLQQCERKIVFINVILIVISTLVHGYNIHATHSRRLMVFIRVVALAVIVILLELERRFGLL